MGLLDGTGAGPPAAPNGVKGFKWIAGTVGTATMSRQWARNEKVATAASHGRGAESGSAGTLDTPEGGP
jgi:hypothetical protein